MLASFRELYHLLPPFQSPKIQNFTLPEATSKPISTSILRLDEVHPVISGNKIFKLWYFLKEAASSGHKTIITFGGAWSNHLAAIALCCKTANLRFIGIIRGEKPPTLSPTLNYCIENGMEPVFFSRANYTALSTNSHSFILKQRFGEHTFVPEGGYSPTGAMGASLICDYIPEGFTHIITATGTATTFAGLSLGCKSSKLIGIPVLKNLKDIHDRLEYLGVKNQESVEILPDYHFGGYAKKTPALIEFMNEFYRLNEIPLDFVYTGKMMYALNSIITRDYFPHGSSILAVHTGGLQGNQSLKEQLIF